MRKKYVVTLSEGERDSLGALISKGKGAARRLAHARVLLKADRGLTDEAVAEAVEVSRPTVERVRKRFVEEGLEAALNPGKPERHRERKLDGELEAKLVALTCSAPPEGQARSISSPG